MCFMSFSKRDLSVMDFDDAGRLLNMNFAKFEIFISSHGGHRPIRDSCC